MSQRILSSSSLPLRQRSDKPPWCECAPVLIRVNRMVREGSRGGQPVEAKYPCSWFLCSALKGTETERGNR